MYEKVNPAHPDKIADRIAGRLVDIAYTRSEGGWLKSNPRIAVEVLIGHGEALVIVETDADLRVRDVTDTVEHLAGIRNCTVRIVPQDKHLADNQQGKLRCGDNGIFKGMPITDEQKTLTALAATLYANFPTDGKYIYSPESDTVLTICQSNGTRPDLFQCVAEFCLANEGSSIGKVTLDRISINPLGEWTGGPDTDSGATNRKLGSDMGDAVTGGGLHGKDLSKMDVTANILCHVKAQQAGLPVACVCAIGDETLTFRYGDPAQPFPDNVPAHPDETISVSDAVEQARLYILTQHGSFEHFAEWGLVCPPRVQYEHLPV